MISRNQKLLFSFLRKNAFLIELAGITFGVAIVLHQPIGKFPSFIDWKTIITLSGLLIITTGIKESGFFYLLAYRISCRINSERLLASFLVFISAILSMFLTNDIALFIIVPLTLSLQEILNSDYSKMVVFEAIAVNVGSSLTPIGNPQNIFLWHKWGISFFTFVKEMKPFVLLLSAWLLIFTFLAFSSKKIKPNHTRHLPINRKLFLFSSILLVTFVFSVELNIEKYFLTIVIISFLIFYRKIILKTDWKILLFFILIFIDIHILYQLNKSHHFFKMAFNLDNAKTFFLSGAFLSQIISNVPASILLSHYSSNYKIIAYSVNVGGNGLLTGSFANIIALNLMEKKSKYFVYHIYSIPFFIVTLIFTWSFLI